jgi:hypothetical protein
MVVGWFGGASVLASRKPKLMGSAPASGAVFRALAENIGRAKISETSVSVTHATGWTRGASSNTRGGCAPQLRFGFKPVFCFYPASARYFRVVTGRSCQIFMAISIPISANGIRKYGQ